MKNIVILGASKGLGQALSTIYAKNKYRLLAISRNTQKLIELQSYFPENINYLSADINDHNARQTICKRINELPQYDLIINAAIAPANLLANEKEESLMHVLSTNLINPIHLINTLIPTMNQTRVLFISSGLAHYHMSGLGAYCLSKAALRMAWMAYNNEVDQNKAIFGSVIPGLIDTEMQINLRNQSSNHLPSVDQFKSFKEEHLLKSADKVAAFIFNVMTKTTDSFFKNTEWDIDQYQARAHLFTLAPPNDQNNQDTFLTHNDNLQSQPLKP